MKHNWQVYLIGSRISTYRKGVGVGIATGVAGRVGGGGLDGVATISQGR